MWHLFLDESGDLGFDFDEKDSSRFLTIAILATSHRETVKAIGCAVQKTLRRKVNSKKKRENELKGTRTAIEVKRYFYGLVSDCTFGIYAMTLDKQGVQEELRSDPQTKSRLYNFIARQVLEQIPFEKAVGPVELIVDKSKGKAEVSEFNAYVMEHLKGRIDPRVSVNIFHRESCADRCLSAIDLFTWGIFRSHERSDTQWLDCFRSKVLLDGQFP
jgi:hypothetical protein